MKQHLPLIAFLTPFLLFFIIASAIPYEQPIEFDASTVATETGSEEGATEIDPDRYFVMIATRVILMTIAIAIFWRYYTVSFPLRVDRWGFVVGVVGAVFWIGVCHLQLERSLFALLGLSEDWLGARAGVNPFDLYPGADRRNAFLVFRFALLVITVPIAEELFLRGFFMRFTDAVSWDKLPLTKISSTGLISGTAYGMLSHPSEFIAAAIWFSLITWLMVKTDKFWNCVLAHAVTNLILGIYVICTGNWQLW
jgi:CAAX prenyl protease-like protein